MMLLPLRGKAHLFVGGPRRVLIAEDTAFQLFHELVEFDTRVPPLFPFFVDNGNSHSSGSHFYTCKGTNKYAQNKIKSEKKAHHLQKRLLLPTTNVRTQRPYTIAN
jgi:hypothetical protein